MTKDEYMQLLRAYETARETAREIESLYDTYTTPKLTESISRTGRPSDPVSKAVNRISALQEKREQAIRILADTETKLEEVPDLETESIIRLRMLGKSWRQIGLMLDTTGESARKKLERYLNSQTPEPNTY